MGRSFEEDPLTAALAPPPNETPAEREVRERAESEAKRVSDEIDAQLRRERESDKKRKPVSLLVSLERPCTNDARALFLGEAAAPRPIRQGIRRLPRVV